MSKPLRLLVVEDSEAGVAPLVRELRRHGYEPEAVRVDAADAMRDALHRQAWDVVIVDHGLSGFSSQDALRVLQESGLDLPFIIVSETLGEAAAVTAMKAGAHDYMMKDHLTRLGPAVERELQGASVRWQRREAERCLAAQQAVTRILAEADTLGEAGAKILQGIAQTGEWEAGEIWAVDRPSDSLRCLEIWHAASKPLGEFETRTRAMTFVRGVGLPGRVWASGQPAWIADVTQDADFPRAPLAAEAGLRGAIGFPIGLPMVVGREVIGVIAFFRTAPGQPDEKLLAVLNAVGSQVGQFLLRQQAEEELKKLSSAVKQTANCVLITDRNGVIEYVNPAFERTTGYAREEVIGKTPRLLNSGHHDQKHFEMLWNTILAGETFFAEFVNRKKSGELYHTEQSITPVRDTQGHITHFISTGRDITERKQTEQALRASEERYRVVAEAAADVIIMIDEEGRIIFANPACLNIFGYTAAEIIGEPITILMPEGLRHQHLSSFQRYLETGQRHINWRAVELVGRRKDGSRFPLEVSFGESASGGKRVFGGVLRDITERKLTEKALKLFRALVDQSNDTIEILDPETGRFLDVNEKGHLALGYSREEFLALSIFDVDPTVDQSTFPGAVEELRKSGILTWEGNHRRKDGSTFPVEVNLKYVRLDRDYVVAAVRDITERRRAAERDAAHLQKLHQLSELSMKLSGDPGTVFEEIVCMIAKLFEVPVVCLSKIAGQELLFKAVFANGQLLRDAGGCPLDITPCATVELTKDLRIYDRVQERFPQASFLRDHNASAYCGFPSLDGQGRVVAVTCLLDAKPHEFTEEDQEILRVIGQRVALEMERSQNLAERKNMERLALRTQRLESIGKLAGGVAHDLNNALAPILMSTQLLRMQYPEATEMIDIIESSARHGADMVRQLLTFAKGVEGARLLIQPQHLLKEMERIVKSTFPKSIELRTHYPDKLQAVLGDSTQLHQVLLNLCVNARDAMPNGGTLTVGGGNAEIDATYASAVPEAKPGRYVVWHVTDTGTGIPPEILEHIFEPFFSTKGPDKGTGLGLSTVSGIVKSHGGFVQVYSTSGQGSTFAVYLPVEGSSKGDSSFLTKAEMTFRGNGETILVVDDEAAVRNVMRAVLAKLNFKVLTASDGTEALVQVSERRAELRVVITDLRMPHMDGLTFVRVLKHMLPGAGIIIASGQFEEAQESEFKALGVNALLHKPFTQETLVAAVKTALQKS